MKPVITFENMQLFSYTNSRLITGKPGGIVISFFGLGCTEMYDTDTAEGKFFAGHNLLYLVPYTNPWGWMNEDEAKLTDELVRVLCKHYGEDLRVASTGGSMGGMAALTYCCKASKTPAVCVANCPVCDFPYHYGERDDLPRTIYSALYRQADGDIDNLKAAMTALSPLHLASSMPDIPYYIFHCTDDRAVNKKMHSDRFVEAMNNAGHKQNMHYIAVDGKGHCDLGEQYTDYLNAVLTVLGGK